MVDKVPKKETEDYEEDYEEDEDYEEEDLEDYEDEELEDEEEEDEEDEEIDIENLFGFNDVFLHRLTVDILKLAFEAHRISLLEGVGSNNTKTILSQLIPLLTAFKSVCRAYNVQDEISLRISADDKELEQLIDKIVTAIYKLREHGA